MFVVASQVRTALRQWSSPLLFVLSSGMGATFGLSLSLLTRATPLEGGDELTAQLGEAYWMWIPASMSLFVGFSLLSKGVLMGLQPPPRLVARHHPLNSHKRALLHLVVSLSGSYVVNFWGMLLGFWVFFPRLMPLQYLGVHVFLLATVVANHVLRNSLLRGGFSFGVFPVLLTLVQMAILFGTLIQYWVSPLVWTTASLGGLIVSYFLLIRDEQELGFPPTYSYAPRSHDKDQVTLFWLKLKASIRGKTGAYWIGAYLLTKLVFSILCFYPEILTDEMPPHSPLWYGWAFPIFALLVNRFGVRAEITLWQLQLERSNRYWLGQYTDAYFWIVTGIDVLLSLPVILFAQAPISLPLAYVLIWIFCVILGLVSSFFFARKAVSATRFNMRQKNPMGWRIFAIYIAGFLILGRVFAAPFFVHYILAGMLGVVGTGIISFLLYDHRLGQRLQTSLESGAEYD